MDSATDAELLRLSAHAYPAEPAALQAMLEAARPFGPLENAIHTRAARYAQAARAEARGQGAQGLLRQYALGSREGVALMCLAEALLRIPDTGTMDELIDSSFHGKGWALPQAADWQGRLAGWGLYLTGAVVDFGHDAHTGLLHEAKGLVARLGEPVIREALRRAMQLLGGQFVLGETVDDAIRKSHMLAAKGWRFSFDVLGEGARSAAQAQHYFAAYHDALGRIAALAKGRDLFAAPSLSVKLSALHPRFQLTARAQLMDELLPRLLSLARSAREAGVMLALDAEESQRLDMQLLLIKALLDDASLAGWNGIGCVVQAYHKRALHVLEWLAGQARAQGRIIPVRLVKGAYWDSEIKSAQQRGLAGYPVFTRKEHTDVSYLACAAFMLEQQGVLYPQFASHNARTVASVQELAAQRGWAHGSYELQRLHGMGEALHEEARQDTPSRIYAPIGPHRDLLAYLIRRLIENGANSSFVHLLAGDEREMQAALADPLAAARETGGQGGVALPGELYGAARRNSEGVDFGNLHQLHELTEAVQRHADAGAPAPEAVEGSKLDALVDEARDGFGFWAGLPAHERAEILEKAADALEARRDELVALCAAEGGKTLADGVAEVREAADFCRYYAQQARLLALPQELPGPTGESNRLSLHPRGVMVCISPWNFPLAIFTGQVAACLAAGNTLVAKPAEQTPRVAALAVRILHEAGVPRSALLLAPGSGHRTGAALVAHAEVDGVVFTGGTETARGIAQTISVRPGKLIPLVAETGGQNCMIVDSSALLEQAVDDIILSAFGSAGQRCSALRVLLVQDDIADDLLALLAGALDELALGDPLDAATDIGPVIDADAKRALDAHIAHMKRTARFVAAARLPEEEGYLVAPHLFEIGSIGELTREHFGPVLHVLRFKAGGLGEAIDAVNSTGYGLTFGIHSRIEEHIDRCVRFVRAGNIYVNRSMTGAVVGVQPFGGEGLSGTGPKAGGPLYLPRLMVERTVTVNSAAIGGNLALLA